MSLWCYYKDNAIRSKFRVGDEYCAISQCALALDPDLQLLDEPNESEGFTNKKRILKVFGDLTQEQLNAYFMVMNVNGLKDGQDHNAKEVQEACDRFMQMIS